LRNGATVISAGTYPNPGTRLISASTCAGGYIHTWDFRDLSASETYEVEAWMIDDSVSYSATLVINTPAAYDSSSSTTINPLSTPPRLLLKRLCREFRRSTCTKDRELARGIWSTIQRVK
jgi:hypothetical protein